MIIEPRDNIRNVFVIKFYNTTFSVDKKYAAVLQQKLQLFKVQTTTRKHLFLTLITTFGFHSNEHSIALVDKQIVIDDLFTAFSYDV